MKSRHIVLLSLLAAFAAPAFAAFQAGDRVECNWKGGGKYYKGQVGAAEGDKLFINYNDGDKEHTSASMCRPLTIASGPMAEGSRVECRWKNGNVWYPGVIAEKTADQVFIHYNDGDKENTTLSKCRPR
ncbi:hypothetical protein BH11PSE11_BH11PSE11_07310 [soil metagenome]